MRPFCIKTTIVIYLFALTTFKMCPTCKLDIFKYISLAIQVISAFFCIAGNVSNSEYKRPDTVTLSTQTTTYLHIDNKL